MGKGEVLSQLIEGMEKNRAAQQVINESIHDALKVQGEALKALTEKRTTEDEAAIEARRVAAAGGGTTTPESAPTPTAETKKPDPHFSIKQDPDGSYSIHEKNNPLPVMAGLTQTDADAELPVLVKQRILEAGKPIPSGGGKYVLRVEGIGSSEPFATEAEALAAQEKAKNPTATAPASAEASKTAISPGQRRLEIIAQVKRGQKP